MTAPSNPIPTYEHLQGEVADLKKWQDQADMLMSVMVEEIKRLRTTLRRIEQAA